MGKPRRRTLQHGLTLAFLLLAFSYPAYAETRLALVVGNSSYSDAPLTNPINDANLMTEALRRHGFKVILVTDVSQKGIKRAIRDFSERLYRAGRDAVGLFYYSGSRRPGQRQ